MTDRPTPLSYEPPMHAGWRTSQTGVMWKILAVVLCAVAVFAQWRVGAFTITRGRAWLTRAILLALGVGVGWTSVRAAQPAGDAIAWFLIGFGLVHVPPALVLLLKELRGEHPS